MDDEWIHPAGPIRLRPWRASEAPRLFSILGTFDVSKWLGSRPEKMRSLAEAAERIERWRSRIAATEGRLGTWAIEVHESEVVAGSIHLDELPNGHGSVEIGWYLHPDSLGHGYASIAGRRMLAKAFADDLTEVLARMRPTNTPSQSVCSRLGMRDCGIGADPW